jgi:hypothetical protein
LRERKLFGKTAQQTVFLTLHFVPRRNAMVIVAEQMQNTVDDVAHDFRLPIRLELLCLQNRVVNANEKFAA